MATYVCKRCTSHNGMELKGGGGWCGPLALPHAGDGRTVERACLFLFVCVCGCGRAATALWHAQRRTLLACIVQAEGWVGQATGRPRLPSSLHFTPETVAALVMFGWQGPEGRRHLLAEAGALQYVICAAQIITVAR